MQARAFMAIQPRPWICPRCNEVIGENEEWVVGHIKSRNAYPELTFNVDNWQHEHKSCSDRSGHEAKKEKMLRNSDSASSIFPVQTPQAVPALFPESLSVQQRALRVPETLGWDHFTATAPTWLYGVLEVPGDASVPLAMTPVHPESVGTYGPEAEEWMREVLKVELRWWQRLALYRLLEYREDGSLVWEQIILSCARRSGKSVWLAALVMWRICHADLFGEPQQVVHTAMNMRIAKEVQRAWWRWVEQRKGDGWIVRKSNGQEEIATPTDDRWLLLPQDGITGYSPGFGVVDECWDVRPLTISENLEPALMDRKSPQLLLTSTAHTRATSLMRTKISQALSDNADRDTLLLLWGAKPQDDVNDREVWRAASPYNSPSRTKIMERKYRAALEGARDPEFDDMEPMEGFKAQYLNIWPMADVKVTNKGQPLITPEAWDDLTSPEPIRSPDSVAIESWYGEGLSVASAWREDGHTVLSVVAVPTLEAAARHIAAIKYRGTVVVGASMMEDPALAQIRKRSAVARNGSVLQELGRLLAAGELGHTGESHLTEQILRFSHQPSHRVPCCR